MENFHNRASLEEKSLTTFITVNLIHIFIAPLLTVYDVGWWDNCTPPPWSYILARSRRARNIIPRARPD